MASTEKGKPDQERLWGREMPRSQEPELLWGSRCATHLFRMEHPLPGALLEAGVELDAGKTKKIRHMVPALELFSVLWEAVERHLNQHLSHCLGHAFIWHS